MQLAQYWLNIIYSTATFLIVAIPTTIALISTIKKKKQATTENERLEAEKDIQAYKSRLIEEAEALYKIVGEPMKQAGLDLAELKKDSVMTKLQNYALSKHYDFDYEYYSKEVDKDVLHTKKVNAE